MPASLVIQSTQESIAALHATAAAWGRVFAEEAAARSQLEAEAEGVARVFEALQLAYGALPRFRTEAALRRFNDALRELVRALRALRLPAATGSVQDALAAAVRGAEQAEMALNAVTGRSSEPVQEPPRSVQGVVHRLLSDRGYGFVRQQGSTTDVFFNSQAVQGVRFAALRTGQAVTFRIMPDPRVPGRMQAIDVKLLA